MNIRNVSFMKVKENAIQIEDLWTLVNYSRKEFSYKKKMFNQCQFLITNQVLSPLATLFGYLKV